MSWTIESTRRLTGLLAAFLTVAPFATAGPPLICHPFDIGDAKSLAWGSGGNNWADTKPGYDLRNLSKDTLALLAPETPAIVRMETLRRAAIYADKDAAVARELLGHLMARTLNAESGGKADAMAWFDAGYFVESRRQLASRDGVDPMKGLNGYDWVMRSLRLGADAASVEFAAGLIRHDAKPNPHFAKAGAQAPKGSLLARNIAKFSNW